MKNLDNDRIRELVQQAYGRIAVSSDEESCGCGCGSGSDVREYAKSLGYSEEELQAIPDAANLALSCGNPTALASLKPGETVLDLGSGAGFDCFLAADRVGPEGRVIGVDMTAEMVEKARANVRKHGALNIEFRLGEIESLPVEDGSIDVVISNCVINLSPAKERVFQEIRRALRPGGRVAVSDIVLLRELPEAISNDLAAYTGCVGGAVTVEEYRSLMEAAGLTGIEVKTTPYAGAGETLAVYIASAYITARK